MSIVLTIDARHVLKKWSTWLAAFSGSTAAGLYAYMQLPMEMQDKFPSWFTTALGIASVVGAMLVPAATSIQQRNIPSIVFTSESDEEMP